MPEVTLRRKDESAFRLARKEAQKWWRSSPRPGVERVAQPVAHVVDAQHGERNREAGPQHALRVLLEVIGRIVEQPSPGGEIRRKAQTQERERGFGDDGVANAQGGGDHDGRDDARQDVAEDDALRGRSERARGENEFALLESEHLSAHDAGGLHPGGRADDRGDEDEDAGLRPEGGSEGVAEQRDDHEQKGQERKRQEDIRQPHERAVQPPEIARRHADHGTQRESQAHGGARHRERDASPREHAGQGVPPQAVGAERMGEAGALVARAYVDEVRVDAPQVGAEHHGEGCDEQNPRPYHRSPVGAELRPYPAPCASHSGWWGPEPRRGCRRRG